MKMASKFAIALVLGATSVIATSPVIAAKKQKVPEGPQPVLSKEFRAAIQPAQTAAKASDPTAPALLAAAEALAQHPDEKFYVGATRFEIARPTKNPAMMRKAINEMIASGSTLPTNLAELNAQAGRLAYSVGDYTDAAAKFSQADKLGSKDQDLHLLSAESYFKLNRHADGLSHVEKAIAASSAAGQKAPEAWYQRASSVAYKAKLSNDVSKWTRMQVKAYPTTENWRSALVTYRDSAKLDGQAQLDLMRLMRVTKSLSGERDFFEYASLATERALPGEAKSSIEEGQASGAVPKTSQAVNEMLTLARGKITADRASLVASEKQAGSAATGRQAKGSADGYLGYGEDAKAIALYQLALQKGGVDADEVNTRLGIAQARAGQKDAARATFAKVTGPRVEIARFWTLWLDTSV